MEKEKKELRVSLGRDSYDIVLERGSLDRAGDYLDLDRKVLILTDAGVPDASAKKKCRAWKGSKSEKSPLPLFFKRRRI